MATFGELQATIADELARTDLTDQIQRAILAGIRYYEKRPFWFLQKRSEFQTGRDQEQYPLPGRDKFISLEWLRLDEHGRDYSLTPIRFSQHEASTRNPRDAGEPRWYAVYNGCLYLSPRPDRAYRMVASYYRGEPNLLRDSDSNEWTTTAADLMRAHALRYLYRFVVHAPEKAAEMAAEEAAQFHLLSSHTAEHHPSNEIGVWDFA